MKRKPSLEKLAMMCADKSIYSIDWRDIGIICVLDECMDYYTEDLWRYTDVQILEDQEALMVKLFDQAAFGKDVAYIEIIKSPPRFGDMYGPPSQSYDLCVWLKKLDA